MKDRIERLKVGLREIAPELVGISDNDAMYLMGIIDGFATMAEHAGRLVRRKGSG